MKRTPFLLLVLLILGSACSKEDSIEPVIQQVVVNGSLLTIDTVQAGVDFSVDVSVADNQALNQLKISIHPADDNHQHPGLDTIEVTHPNIGTWTETRVIQLTGTSESVSTLFTVPDSIGGTWHLNVELIDTGGNLSPGYFTILEVENDQLPVFSLTGTVPELDENGIMHLAPGEVPLLLGSVEDPNGLDSLWVQTLVASNEDVAWETSINVMSSWYFDLSAIVFEPLNDGGEFLMRLRARDSNGFENIIQLPLIIE